MRRRGRRLLAELAAALLAITILCVTGLAIGWSIDGSVLEALGGFALLVLFSGAMIATGTLLGDRGITVK